MLSACKARLKTYCESVQSVPATNTKFLWCPLAWEPSKGRASSGLATVCTQCLKHWLNVCGLDAFLVFSDQNLKQEPGSGCSIHLAPRLFLTSQAPPCPVLEDARLCPFHLSCLTSPQKVHMWNTTLSESCGVGCTVRPIRRGLFCSHHFSKTK